MTAIERLYRWKKVALIISIVECLIYAGTIYGWVSLVYVLKDEGFYANVCPPQGHSKNVTESTTSAITTSTTIPLNSRLLPSSSPRSAQTNHDQDLVTDTHANNTYDDDSQTSKIPMNISFLDASKLRFTVAQCGERDFRFSLIFSVAMAFQGVGACALGKLHGLKGSLATKLAIVAMICVGCLLVALASPGQEWLLFPGLSLMSAAGKGLKVTNCPVANLFPTYRPTLLSLIFTGIGVSAGVQLVVKLCYEAGISRQACFLFLAALSLTMVPAALAFMPRGLIEMPKTSLDTNSKKKKRETGPAQNQNGTPNLETNGNIIKPQTQSTTVESHKRGILSENKDNLAPDKQLYRANEGYEHDEITLELEVSAPPVPTCNGNANEARSTAEQNTYSARKNDLRQHESVNEKEAGIPGICAIFRTTTFLNMQLWFFANTLCVSWFLVTLNSRLEAVLGGQDEVSAYTNISLYVQVFGAICLAPLSGIIYNLSYRFKVTRDIPSEKHKNRIAAVINFLTGCLVCIALSSLILIQDESVFFPSFLLFQCARAFVFGVATTYALVSFPARHVGVVIGVQELMSSVSSLLQSPLVLWKDATGIRGPGLLVLSAVCLSVLHPIYIIVRAKMWRDRHKEPINNGRINIHTEMTVL